MAMSWGSSFLYGNIYCKFNKKIWLLWGWHPTQDSAGPEFHRLQHFQNCSNPPNHPPSTTPLTPSQIQNRIQNLTVYTRPSMTLLFLICQINILSPQPTPSDPLRVLWPLPASVPWGSELSAFLLTNSGTFPPDIRNIDSLNSEPKNCRESSCPQTFENLQRLARHQRSVTCWWFDHKWCWRSFSQ